MRRIAKKQVDLEQREQFDMLRSSNYDKYEMRNRVCDGIFLNDKVV